MDLSFFEVFSFVRDFVAVALDWDEFVLILSPSPSIKYIVVYQYYISDIVVTGVVHDNELTTQQQQNQ